jgi:PAS domain S-box-containing protein
VDPPIRRRTRGSVRIDAEERQSPGARERAGWGVFEYHPAMNSPAPSTDFRALVEAAGEPVAVARDGRIVFANAAMAECLGHTSAEAVTGLDEEAFVGAHGADGAPPRWFDPGASGGEASLRRADGGTRVVRWRAAPVSFGGAPARALFFRDVTDELGALAAQRQADQNFRAIIERSPLAVCVTQGDRVVYVNRAMLDYLGYEGEDGMKGPTLAALSDQIVDPVDRQRLRDAFRELFADLSLPDAGRPARVVRIDDCRLRSSRDGALRFCDIHGIVVSHDGRPALVTYLHDQTERRAHAARIRLADRMSSLGTLAAGVAHEINNPLTYVIGNVELVAQQLAESAPRAAGELGGQLGAARMGLDRIRKTVWALKTFSRGDEEVLGPVDVVAVLESCIDIAASQLRHRGTILRDYADVPRVTGNDARLAQVFLNLLLNAAQALDESRTAENRVVARVFADGGAVTVEIRDNGVGIAPQDLPRVFDPFFTTKPVGVGTGLGLFVCHGIVEAHGGEIGIDSAPGRGTAVVVRLPAAAPAAAAPAPLASAAPRAKARVLVVDDEPEVRDLVRAVLSAESEVDTAASAAEALEHLQGPAAYDLVLCDLMMPETSGADLCRRLESERPDAARRIVFMTGGAVSENLDAYLAESPRPVLDKPFTPDELKEFVRQQLQHGRWSVPIGSAP